MQTKKKLVSIVHNCHGKQAKLNVYINKCARTFFKYLQNLADCHGKQGMYN